MSLLCCGGAGATHGPGGPSCPATAIPCPTSLAACPWSGKIQLQLLSSSVLPLRISSPAAGTSFSLFSPSVKQAGPKRGQTSRSRVPPACCCSGHLLLPSTRKRSPKPTTQHQRSRNYHKQPLYNSSTEAPTIPCMFVFFFYAAESSC